MNYRHELLQALGAGALAIWPDWLQQQLAAEDVEAAIHPATERAIARRSGSVAVVPIAGPITPRRTMLEMFGLATSVQTIGANLRAALQDPDVKAIVLDIHSPGGNVWAVPELADEIFAARGQKPIVAQVDFLAASAAYWIAASADEIVASPSSDVGSIGVFTLHMDFSKMLEMDGVKPTFIFGGKFKTEGNPFEPLTDEAKAALQATIDQAYGTFLQSVARGRGVTIATVRDEFGEGRMFPAATALTMGMVDKIRTLQETLGALGVDSSQALRSSGSIARRRVELDVLTII